MKNESFMLKLSFYRSQVKTEEIIALMRSLMFFQPKSFKSNRKDFKRLGCKNFWEQVEIGLNCNDSFRASLEALDPETDVYNRLKIQVSSATGIVVIRFTIQNDSIDVCAKTEKVINDFVLNHHILSASLRSRTERDWNDDHNLENQWKRHPELREIKTMNIAMVDFADPEQFAGHTHFHKGLWFGCTYEMWYGPDYDRYIPLEKIASFDDCSEKEIFENGTVRIRMYDSYADFSKPESVRRAWGFRHHTDCDAAADYWTEEINKLIVAQMEYQVEMEYGEFPHGGMCLMKAYLDENGKPITKSKAVKVHISERGTDGKSVFQEIVEL